MASHFQMPPIKPLLPHARFGTLLKRFLVLGVVGITVYVTVGCVLFPEWWFPFLWGGELNWHYAANGMTVLLDEYFTMVIGIVIAICVTVILGTFFKANLFRFVDNFAVRILFATLMVLFISSLVIFHTQKWRYDLQKTMELLVMISDNARKALAASNSPPHIMPPVDFQYIDTNRVNELYNQIEPDLIERERTIAATGSVKGKVGVGVGEAVTAKAEIGKSASSTSSFTRVTFSTERKCVELMNYLVDYRNPGYYTTSQHWYFGRENAALAAQRARSEHESADVSNLHPIKPLNDPESLETPTEEEKREAARKVTQYQAELQNELQTIHGYVFVNGEFDRTAEDSVLTLTETFSAKPHRVLFRISIPRAQVPEFENKSRLRFILFGDVIHPLSGDGYVDVRPIAIY